MSTPGSSEENVGVASYTVSSLVTTSPTGKKKNDNEEEEMSTTALELQLQRLRDKSNELSQELTQRLASSESGQNLLSIGPSLSTLPPDISSLITATKPLLESVSEYLESNQAEYERLIQLQHSINYSSQKAQLARECMDIWQELTHAEESILLLLSNQSKLFQTIVEVNSDKAYETLEQMASLEQCAQTTLRLRQHLEESHSVLSSITQTKSKSGITSYTTGANSASPTSEKAQFVNKLSSRIHTLETNTTKCLLTLFDSILSHIRHYNQCTEVHTRSVGHCLRGLALLGKPKDAESVFSRVAMMPLIRSKVSMGRLDQGGGRGECAGLFSLLDDLVCTVSDLFGPVLVLCASIFPKGHVDLVTTGVWVPIANTFMADPSMKMAIFSPGIASILQANFMALHLFLSELAERLLTVKEEETQDSDPIEDSTILLSKDIIQAAQDRLYKHEITVEFEKKWNLPIYYQLRFGECCTRLNRAIARVQRDGWTAQVFTGTAQQESHIKSQVGLELSLFIELYDILLFLWQPNVVLRPLTHRFLRGAIQLLGRAVAFLQEGLEKTILFGGSTITLEKDSVPQMDDDQKTSEAEGPSEYSWADNPATVATVAWDLTVLESAIINEYCETVVSAVCQNATEPDELQTLIQMILADSVESISPLIVKSWNETIATHLIAQCSQPLAAVKGVAATYRMTNRPPPTLPSPFVSMILRPLVQFDEEFSNRTSPQVGLAWKEVVVSHISQKYSIAVEELLETVRRTEESLLSRRGAAMMARRTGMTDGDKVKLQMLLDFNEFQSGLKSLGLEDGLHLDGVAKLHELTEPANHLLDQVRM